MLMIKGKQTKSFSSKIHKLKDFLVCQAIFAEKKFNDVTERLLMFVKENSRGIKYNNDLL